MTSCSPLIINRRVGWTCRLNLQDRRSQARNQRESRWKADQLSCLASSSTLKLEATYSAETSIDFQLTTRRYIPEDRTLHNHHSSPMIWCRQVHNLRTKQNSRDKINVVIISDNRSKINVKLSLCLISWAARSEDVVRNGGMAPEFFYLSTRQRWKISLTPRPLYCRG
jgi:hypothetical protein